MIVTEELYMYGLDDSSRKLVIEAIQDAGYYIKWDMSITDNIDDLVYLETTGLWYDSSQLKTCNCCDKQYLVTNNKDNYAFWSEHEEDDVAFCSSVCFKDAGYRRDPSDGSYTYNPTVGQLAKAGYKCSTHISEVTDEHPFLIGLEIEKEDKPSWYAINSADGLKAPKGWLYVHDGSLNDYGLELVSHGYNLTQEKRTMIEAIDASADFINGTTSNRCGGHISISEKGKTSHQLAKELLPLISFMLTLFPNRMLNSKINKINFDDTLSNLSNKYQPLRLDSNGRVELRMLSRVKSVKSLKRRIEVVQWFLENKPTFKQTKRSMENGFLKETMSAVYGTETWEEKIEIFTKMSLWYCWNVNPTEVDTIISQDT